MDNTEIYLEYILNFYNDVLKGNTEGRPLSYLEYTEDDKPSLLDDLVDIIEKLK